ncbi:MAG: CoA transferase [Alphaproteobacteria bacterium]|nr:CoA transferase [Alphaproteobacteria bacterium]
MKPLAGLLVVDFSRVLAAPFSTMILAELGARVIKIEHPKGGDETRGWEPRLSESESAYFFAFNRAKESVTLDLKQAEARNLARALALQADVLVENFPPGTMAGFGLDYPALAAENPRLIYLANTGFGQSGPYSDRKGYDTVFQAMGGMMGLTGEAGGGPVKAGLPTADLTSGLWDAIAVLAALAGRNLSGHGCLIDLSMFDAQASLLTIAAARWFALGEVPGRSGTEHPGRVPSAAFRCADDKWLHITGSDQHWQPLCAALGLDALAADAALAKNAERVRQRERVMAGLREACARRKRAEVLAALEAREVPCGPVNAVDETLSDPHIRARGVVGRFDHPTVGRFPALALPIKFAGYRDPEIGRPPLLGEHTEPVLTEFFGFDASDFARLRKAGAIK